MRCLARSTAGSGIEEREVDLIQEHDRPVIEEGSYGSRCVDEDVTIRSWAFAKVLDQTSE